MSNFFAVEDGGCCGRNFTRPQHGWYFCCGEWGLQQDVLDGLLLFITSFFKKICSDRTTSQQKIASNFHQFPTAPRSRVPLCTTQSGGHSAKLKAEWLSGQWPRDRWCHDTPARRNVNVDVKVTS